VSATTAYSCCCVTGVTYYADRCNAFSGLLCCDVACCDGPAQIEFCESYLEFIGIPVPLDPTKCYIISYLGCAYELKGLTPTPFPCPPGSGLNPINVGTLLSVRDQGEQPCCSAEPQTHVPVGGIGNLEVEGQPVVTPPQDICADTVADCYDKCDQFGTNESCPLTMRSNMTACYKKWGVAFSPNPDGRDCVCCDRDFPRESYATTGIDAEQRVGICIPDLTQIIQSMIPDQQAGIYLQVESTPAVCPDCPAALDYCCIEGDICEQDPDLCINIEDPTGSHSLFTFYSVVSGMETGCADHVAEVMKICFPFCFAENEGLDPSSQDPEMQEQVRNFYMGLVSIKQITDQDPCIINTEWPPGPLAVPCMEICDYTLNILSGNAFGIAQRINARLNPVITATALGDGGECFWFGYRQSCVDCGFDLSPRPPFSPGDTLNVDHAEILPASQQVCVYLTGTSIRYRACACQIFEPVLSVRNVVNTAISGNCLSPAEYGCGKRYEMIPVSQDATSFSGCIGDNLPPQAYVECDEIAWSAGSVWPYNDIEIFDPVSQTFVVLVYGYSSICGLCQPSTDCRTYPLQFEINDCEYCQITPVGECAELCDEAYYDPKIFCKTNANTITLT